MMPQSHRFLHWSLAFLRRPVTLPAGVILAALLVMYVQWVMIGETPVHGQALVGPEGEATAQALLAAPVAATGGSTIPWMPETVTRYLPVIRRHCTGQADEELAQIIMLVESCGNATIVNSSNAHGLMQIVPRWHPECGDPARLLDPDTNVECGCRFLDRLLAVTGDAGDAAYRYNSGTLQTDEGARYRYWVEGMAAERHQPTSARFDEWYSRAHGMCSRAGL